MGPHAAAFLFHPMRITILGSSAGGGFPQWNCHCRNCAGVRDGSLRATPRTQSSIFVQARPGGPGVLVNASPDVLAQVKAQPVLWPAPEAGRMRHSPIAAVLLCDGQVDHVTGLAMLRERGAPLPLWCTDPVHEDLSTGNPVLKVLGHYCGVARHVLPLDGTLIRPAVDLQTPDSDLRHLAIRALTLDSQPPPYSPRRGNPVAGDNIGLVFENTLTGRRIFYAPGLGEISPAVWEAMSTADVVMVQDFISQPPMREVLASKDNKAWFIPVGIRGELGSPESSEAYKRVVSIVDHTVSGSTLTVHMTGLTATVAEREQIGLRDLRVIETATVGMVLLILFVVYRNVVTILVPLATITLSQAAATQGVAALATWGLPIDRKSVV
mgnify:CR=1 FL=1